MITTPRNKNAIVRVPKDDLIDAIPQAAKKLVGLMKMEN
jgi:hypothetical protein